MENFIEFFANLKTLDKLIWLLSCLLFFWILESIMPLFSHGYKKWRHDGVNLVFMVFILLINVLFGIATVGVYAWLDTHQFGLLNWININIWGKLVIAVMALDLISQYAAHYFLHRIKWMWKLHMVHHSDTKVDATTGTRQHPVEYMLRETFALAAIVLFGIPLGFYLAYRMLTIFFTYWTHANISLPGWLDKALSYLIITPNAHKFHHHFERPWTDTNFGNVLSIWDRIFGTFVYENPKDIVYGLDVLDGEKDEDIGYQLKLPLDKSVKTDY